MRHGFVLHNAYGLPHCVVTSRLSQFLHHGLRKSVMDLLKSGL